VEDKELLELIKQLIALDKDIQKRIDELRNLIERDGFLSTDQSLPYVT
jgi:hypothetical protein